MPPLSIVVMGVSGVGKSTVGAALAKRLRLPFADADDLHPPNNIHKMTWGNPLDDADRYPWLDSVGLWLAAHPGGGVMSCSALKKDYRNQLRQYCPDVIFVHLTGAHDLIVSRQSRRLGHFMPSSLMTSQLATLEPLASEEGGMTVDAALNVESIVICVERFLSPGTQQPAP